MVTAPTLAELEISFRKNKKRLWIFGILVFWIGVDIVLGFIFDNSFISVGLSLLLKVVAHPEAAVLISGILVSVLRILFFALLAFAIAERRKLKKLRKELGQVM